MQHVDCLSRNPVAINTAVNITEGEWIRAVQTQDDEISRIIHILQGDKGD